MDVLDGNGIGIERQTVMLCMDLHVTEFKWHYTRHLSTMIGVKFAVYHMTICDFVIDFLFFKLIIDFLFCILAPFYGSSSLWR